ncbi:MAG TPA: alanine racemase [Nannocystaceae bacterium]|nr:alanine racemase [Nannocystaceae bacterium]
MDEIDRAARLDRALASAPAGVQTPALVIDLDAVDANIAAMIAAAGSADRWRPHVKTVKQGVVVDALLAAGVRRMKCATLAELDLLLARADSRGVAIDVLVAYPLSAALAPALVARGRGRHRIAALADAPDHLAALAASAPALELWLDVDVGMHRTGTASARWREWIPERPPSARIAGLHGYEGHLGWHERTAAFAAYDALVELAAAIGDVAAIHTSGSHGFAHALAHPALGRGPWRHEIGCGTLVLSDVASADPAAAIGVRPAAFVAARVVARPGEDRVTLDAGSKAIAPDRPPPSCRVLAHPELRAGTPSEEHLPLIVAHGRAPGRDEIVWLVPDHVCTTVNLYREAIYIRGDRFVGTGPIEAAGRPGPWYGSPAT